MAQRYKLKKWYPSLPEPWRFEAEVYERDIILEYLDFPINKYWSWDIPDSAIAEPVYLSPFEVETNHEFWEKIEDNTPLLTTDDNDKVFSPEVDVYLVNVNTLSKTVLSVKNVIARNVMNNPGYKWKHKIFFSSTNADNYIEDNKAKYSKQDVKDAFAKVKNMNKYEIAGNILNFLPNKD